MNNSFKSKWIYIALLETLLIIIGVGFYIRNTKDYNTKLKKSQEGYNSLSGRYDSLKTELATCNLTVSAYKQSLNKTKEVLEQTKYNNSFQSQPQLDRIEEMLTCQAKGGKYLGSGSCCLTNCDKWLPSF